DRVVGVPPVERGYVVIVVDVIDDVDRQLGQPQRGKEIAPLVEVAGAAGGLEEQVVDVAGEVLSGLLGLGEAGGVGDRAGGRVGRGVMGRGAVQGQAGEGRGDRVPVGEELAAGRRVARGGQRRERDGGAGGEAPGGSRVGHLVGHGGRVPHPRRQARPV